MIDVSAKTIAHWTTADRQENPQIKVSVIKCDRVDHAEISYRAVKLWIDYG
ncbi:hypothetical protein GALL_505970 [mine drainage metagenome]|uniref:Uncharacterized protein n=1 Tax=mine drainage metagenome TaxID=410659 RepID=A0A1J5PJV3_9ZZZZ